MGKTTPPVATGFVVENAPHHQGELAQEFKLVRWGWCVRTIELGSELSAHVTELRGAPSKLFV